MSTEASAAPSTAERTPFGALPGAVLGRPAGGGADAGVPAHYGNPLVEQRLLEAGAAIVDLSNRGVLSITGVDRLSWLDSLTSQSLRLLAPGDSAESLLLDPSGRIEHVLRLLDDGETTWILVEAAAVQPLLSWLLRMRFMLRVEVHDRTAEFATVGGFADFDVVPAAAPAGVPLRWRDPWFAVTPGGYQYAAEPHPSETWAWREVLVPRTALGATLERVRAGEVAVAGTLAMEALRIAAWRPRAATELDDRSIPHELDWLRSAVHLSKGCYRGQETVAKVHNLGHPPRRLVLLHLDGSESSPVLGGDPVEIVRDGVSAVVGTVTSSGMHHELGPIALAVVKRNVDTESDLVVVTDDARVAASQQVIVPSDAGAAANVPRLPRIGARTR